MESTEPRTRNWIWVTALIALVPVAYLVLIFLAGRLLYSHLGGTKAVHFANASEVINEDGRELLPTPLWGQIPPSATNIFVCYGGRDLQVICSMSVPEHSELVKAAEQLSGVSIREFGRVDVNTDIFRPAPNLRNGLSGPNAALWWDIDRVTDGLEYSQAKDKRRESDGAGRTVVVDPGRRRIYFYFWST